MVSNFTEITDRTSGTLSNDLLEHIQNVFTVVYIIIYSCGLIVASFYAVYKENNRTTNSRSNKTNKDNDHDTIHDIEIVEFKLGTFA